MLQNKILLGRKSLFTTLLIVVLLLAGLAVTAALGGWWLLHNVSDSQQHLARQSIPLISAAHSLATQSAAIALIAPQIPNINSEDKLAIIYRQLRRHLDFMETVPRQIERISGNTKSDLATVVEDIRGLFSDIRSVVARKLEFEQSRDLEVEKIQSQLSAINVLVNAAIADQSDAIFTGSETMNRHSAKLDDLKTADRMIRSSLDAEVLFNMNRHVAELDSLMQKLTVNSDLGSVKDIKSRVDFQLRLLVSESVALSPTEISHQLASNLNSLYQRLSAIENPIALQQQVGQINLELVEIYGILQDEVHRLNLKTKHLVNLVEIDTKITSETATRTATLSTDLSLFVALLSLLISSVAIWFFVIRRIIRPLRQLTGNLRDISQNRLDFNVEHYSMSELNEMAFAIGVFRDNSVALAEQQKMLEENFEQLTRLNQDLNAFVQVASHDLKSPLHGIQILSDFIVDDLKANNLDAVNTNLDLLRQRIHRMEALMDALLGYTRADSVSVETGPVETRRVILEAFDLVSNNSDFDLLLPEYLPDCQVVESDLMILFMNLFENAISHHDRDKGRIEVTFAETTDQFIFEVSDDGPGIDHDYHELIFEVLQTLKSRDLVEGSGVGLAHARRLLESRGGSIDVNSNPQLQRGSRFILKYPKPSVPV